MVREIGKIIIMTIEERAINKIDSAIINKNLEIAEWNRKLDVGLYGLTNDQIQGVIDGLHREKDVYLYIKSKL